MAKVELRGAGGISDTRRLPRPADGAGAPPGQRHALSRRGRRLRELLVRNLEGGDFHAGSPRRGTVHRPDRSGTAGSRACPRSRRVGRREARPPATAWSRTPSASSTWTGVTPESQPVDIIPKLSASAAAAGVE